MHLTVTQKANPEDKLCFITEAASHVRTS